MLEIKTLTLQEYKENIIRPSGFVFFSTEDCLVRAIARFGKTVEDTISNYTKLLPLLGADIYLITHPTEILYLINYDLANYLTPD